MWRAGRVVSSFILPLKSASNVARRNFANLASSHRVTLSARMPRALPLVPSRSLAIHEHQALGLMRKFRIKVMKGKVATDPESAEMAARLLRTDNAVVKAQVLAGGRGKGKFKNSGLQGGVHLAKNPKEVRSLAEQMLGDLLVTKQTGDKGARCRRILIQEAVPSIKHEAYFAVLMDRQSQGPVMIGSRMGGMDIEAVAHDHPEEMHKEIIDIRNGPQPDQLTRLAQKLGFTAEAVPAAAEQMANLYEMFSKTDATQVEINPFIETVTNEVYCLDAKLNFDDNAEFRQTDLFPLRDTSEEDYRDVTAKALDLNYIGLDGTIGCLVNGAGLAMATMDIIKLAGGSPANFLDIGGGATEAQVTAAFKLLTEDAKVQVILVNIFGGIMKCDVIAQGIVAAAKEVELDMPLVVRLQGTNQEAGRKLLMDSGLMITTADNLEDAANKAVKAIPPPRR